MGGTFGWHIAALWIAASAALSLAAGVMLSRFDFDRWIEPFVFNTRTVQLGKGPRGSTRT